MFDRLARCNQTGIDRSALAEIFDRFLTLRDDAINRFAGLGLWPLAYHFEHLFEALDWAGALLRRPIRLARMWKRRPFNGLFCWASISRWMRRMFAFSTAKAWWFARARPSRRRRRLPANC